MLEECILSNVLDLTIDSVNLTPNGFLNVKRFVGQLRIGKLLHLARFPQYVDHFIRIKNDWQLNQ